MKRIVVILFAAILTMALIACGAPGAVQQAADDVDDSSGDGWDNIIDDNTDGQQEEAAEEDDLTAQEEAMAEEIVESMLGDEADIDISDGGDTITIEGEDGEGEVVIEGGEGQTWPSGDLPAYVPEAKGVNVVGTLQVTGGYTVMFEGCTSATAEAYIAAMEAAGWSIMMNMESDGMQIVSGSYGDGESLQFSWTEEENGSGAVTYIGVE